MWKTFWDEKAEKCNLSYTHEKKCNFFFVISYT